MGGIYNIESAAQRRQRELKELAPSLAAQTPSMSDQAIRDAILAERSRLLTGNSRKQAFAVRQPSQSFLGM